jgi:hypothetical protein
VSTYSNLAVSTYRNLGRLHPSPQAERQRLGTSLFPDSSSRIPSSIHPFHLTLQACFLNTNADSDHHGTLARCAFRILWRLLSDHLYRVEPPLAGCVVAVSSLHEVLAGLDQLMFRALVARSQGHWNAQDLNLPGPGNSIAADGAKPWTGWDFTSHWPASPKCRCTTSSRATCILTWRSPPHGTLGVPVSPHAAQRQRLCPARLA